MRELSIKEAMSLKTIVVADNDRVVGIEISNGTTGMGGSNTSGDSEDRRNRYSLQELKRKKPLKIWCGLELCAVIGDQFYLRSREENTLEAYGKEGKYILGDAVAYDTCEYQRIHLIYREG